MVLIGLLLVAGFLLSRPAVQRALPFESLLAVGGAGALIVVLFELDRLA